MLKEFSDGTRAVALETSFHDKDWNSYRIAAHSLKSAAKMVGFAGLSGESAELEGAAKAGDIAYIRENHSKVVGYYKQLAEALNAQGL